MKPRLVEILDVLAGLAPPYLAEDWDNVGLMLGDPGAEVTGVLVALDPDPAAIESAASRGANCLVTHHPLFFKPFKSLPSNQPLGRAVAAAWRAGVSVVCAHTNLDAAPAGVNHWLALALEMRESSPLVRRPDLDGAGLGRVGRLEPAPTLGELADRVKRALAVPTVRLMGDPRARVERLAVVGGSGGSLVGAAAAAGATALVAGEIGYHAAREAQSLGLALVEAGHLATERVILEPLARELAAELARRGLGCPVDAHRDASEPFEVR